MSGGRERAVVTWDVQHLLLVERLEAIESALAEQRMLEEPPSRKRRERMTEMAAERVRLMAQLARMGPSPRAKMG